MTKKLHFMQLDKWYQYLCSTAYDERDFKEWEIIREVSTEVDERELDTLRTAKRQDVREMIKKKIEDMLN